MSNEDFVKQFETFHAAHTTNEKHREFLESLPTTPHFVGRVEMTREEFLGSEYEVLLERQLLAVRKDMSKLRRYMAAKGF